VTTMRSIVGYVWNALLSLLVRFLLWLRIVSPLQAFLLLVELGACDGIIMKCGDGGRNTY